MFRPYSQGSSHITGYTLLTDYLSLLPRLSVEVPSFAYLKSARADLPPFLKFYKRIWTGSISLVSAITPGIRSFG